MANHHVIFAMGSHMRFESIDFICLGDNDSVLLPPSVPLDSTNGADAITEVIHNLLLYGAKIGAPKEARPLEIDYLWLECQLDALLGPNLSQKALHVLYFSFTNVIVQLAEEPLLSPKLVIQPAVATWLYGTHNATKSYSHSLATRACP
jgi:hypothetical protein